MSKRLFAVIAVLMAAALSGGPVSLDRVVAVVNDKPILKSSFDEELSFKLSSAQMPAMVNIDSLKDDVLQGMIDEIIIREIMKEESIRIDSSLVEKDAQSKLNDLKKNNFPDSTSFAEFLKSSNLTENELLDIYFKQIYSIAMKQQIIGRKGISMVVEENDLKKFYEEKKDSFAVPVNFDLYHMAFVIQPETTAMYSAMQKMESLVQFIKSGQDFANVAKEYSDDKSASKGGIVGYKKYSDISKDISSFLFFYRKADTLLFTQTKEGYRIIRILDGGEDSVKFQQILVRVEVTHEDSAAAMKKAEKALSKLKAGADFMKTASEMSDDYSTSSKGGFIAKVSGEMLGDEIRDKILKLGEGEFSGIMPSDFGYEIFMIKNRQGGYTSAYEDTRDIIKNIIETRRMESEIDMLVKEKRAKSYIRIIG